MGKFTCISLTAATMLAASVLLAGCVPAKPQNPTAPTPTVTPMFATDEQALAAATEAYAAYVKVSDQIANDGGYEPDRIAAHVTTDQFQRDRKVFEMYQEKKYASRGFTKFDSMKLQTTLASEISNSLLVYVCLDFSNVKLTDVEGMAIASDVPRERTPMQVSFKHANTSPVTLKVEMSEQWSGKNFCRE